jgi:hypothetical protein
LFAFLQVHLFPSTWEYGYNFLIEYAYDGNITQNCGVEVEFDQSSRASHHDQNLIEGKLDYIGKIKKIMQVEFSSFQ